VPHKHPPVKLTDLVVKHAKPRPGEIRSEFFDAVLPAFVLRVSRTGAKSYACYYRIYGRLIRFTIGNVKKIGLADARQRARDAFAAADQGIDMAAQKRAHRGATAPLGRSVEDQAREFIKRHVEGQRTAAETKASIERDIIGTWGSRHVRSIMKADVVELLDKIQDAGHLRARNKRLALVSRFWHWMIGRGVVDINPAIGIAKLKEAEAPRQRVLNDDELRAIWTAVDGMDYPAREFVHLLMLTAVRRDEAATVERGEVDFEAKIWTIPERKFKTGFVHLVPLPDAAVDLFKTLPTLSEPFLLSCSAGKRPLCAYHRVKKDLDRRCGVTGWVFHDLRRTVRTRLSALGVNSDVAELILGHRVGSVVRQVYDRHLFLDERRAALNLWARTLQTIIDNKTGENIVALRR